MLYIMKNYIIINYFIVNKKRIKLKHHFFTKYEKMYFDRFLAEYKTLKICIRNISFF